MANVIPSPYMSLPVPEVSIEVGPAWATDVNASLSIIDSHNHSNGQGVPVNPAGLDISADLTFQNNNATDLRTSRYQAQGSPLALSTDVNCVYVVGVDLYYNDGNGNQVRITQSGSVTGATGTITGLPSGTASASYAAGIFTFQSATLTPAQMNVGPLKVGNSTASAKTVTIAPNATIAADYSFTLPAAVPTATSFLTADTSANVGYAVYAEGTWTPTISGKTNVASATALVGRYQQIGNYVYCWVSLSPFTLTTSATNTTYALSLPVAPTNNFSNANQAAGIAASTIGNLTPTGGAFTGTKTILFSSGSALSGTVFNGMMNTFWYIINT